MERDRPARQPSQARELYQRIESSRVVGSQSAVFMLSFAHMKRNTNDPLIALIAVLLLATSLGFLLLPQYQKTLLAGLSIPITHGLGILLHISGIVALAQIPIAARRRIVVATQALLTIWMAALAFLYAHHGFLVEALLFGGLVLAIPMIIQQNEGAAPNGNGVNLLVAYASLLNLVVGLGLLVWSAADAAAVYPSLSPYRLLFSLAFLLSAGAGGLILRKPPPRLQRHLLSVALAFPWFGWSFLSIYTRSASGLIPAFALAMTLSNTDYIPWARLKLPPADLIGLRFIRLAAILQTIFLIVTTLLLETAQIEQVSSISGWGYLRLNSRELAFVLLSGTEALLIYALISLVAIINGLAPLSEGETAAVGGGMDPAEMTTWDHRIERLITPILNGSDAQKRIGLLSRQIQTLGEQLASEKRRSTQLTLLSELSQQLENQLDAPVASQLAVNTLQRSVNCSLTTLYMHEPERRELVAITSAGQRTGLLPPGYRQSVNAGILGRAARLRKTQVVNDTRLEPDFIKVNDEKTLSLIVVPLVDRGHLKAALEISSDQVNAFDRADIQIAEAAAAELLRAWERSEYHQRLMELIQAGISLTAQPDPQSAAEEVAAIARQTLRARFAFVTLLDQDGNFTRNASAGLAPRLLKSLRQNPAEEPLMQAALNSAQPFRIRDLRKYKHASHIELDQPALRSMIAIPIRMHRLSVGAMLAFGKQGEVFFTENDESLASLLSSQASAAIESAWLSHELRSNLTSITQLYQLSFHVIQAQELSEAARFIAETTQKISEADTTGILLLTPDGRTEAQAQVNCRGEHVPPAHPMQLIQRTLESGQSIFQSQEGDPSAICFPLKTSRRTYGALWLTLPDRNSARFATSLQTLANQAALALERSILLVESRQQAREVENAYRELETTYDHTLAALMSALDARDRETEGHSLRVAQIARILGEKLGLTATQLKALERGSLLHDIGKIGISDAILHKPGPLDEAEWKIMRLHPDIGARIVEGIPFLQDTLAVIRYHQERWDGSGYPVGLSGLNIPYLARIFAVADAFDALTSNRPYRMRVEQEEAMQYLRQQAGILFDPQVVQVLDEIAATSALSEPDLEQ